MKTYIVQIRQRWFAQEESKIHLVTPGQAHCSSLVYNLCSCLILIVCHEKKKKVMEMQKWDKLRKFMTEKKYFFSAFYRASVDFQPVPAQPEV